MDIKSSMNLEENYDYLNLTINVLNTIKNESCCHEVRNEHLTIIFEDLFKDMNVKINFNQPEQGFEYLRRIIIGDENLKSVTKTITQFCKNTKY